MQKYRTRDDVPDVNCCDCDDDNKCGCTYPNNVDCPCGCTPKHNCGCIKEDGKGGYYHDASVCTCGSECPCHE